MKRTVTLLAVLGLLGATSASTADTWRHSGQIVNLEPSYVPGAVAFAFETRPEECTRTAFITWRAQGASAEDRILNTRRVMDMLSTALVHDLEVVVSGTVSGAGSKRNCVATRISVGEHMTPDEPTTTIPGTTESACKEKQWLCTVRATGVETDAGGMTVRFSQMPSEFCTAALRWAGRPMTTQQGESLSPEMTAANRSAASSVFADSMSYGNFVEIVGEGCNVCFVHLLPPNGSERPCRPY